MREPDVSKLKRQLACFRGAYSALLDVCVALSPDSGLSVERREAGLSVAMEWFRRHQERHQEWEEHAP